MQDRLGRKGVRGTLARTALLPLRYGLTSERMRRRLLEMVRAMVRIDVVPTINVTACNLTSLPTVIKDLEGADVGIHGYLHTAYDTLSPEKQAADLDLAIRAFQTAGFRPIGFRAPYLRPSQALPDLLISRGFQFDSSMPNISWGATKEFAAEILELSRTRYRSAKHGPLVPYRAGQLVEIPVSVPDDEILVDGLGITNPSALERIFGSMLSRTVATGDLLVLQIHPERYDTCAEPLRRILARALDAGGWVASLSAIAAWTAVQSGSVTSWPGRRPFALAVTGDLDALRLGDFTRRLIGAIS